MQNLGSRIRKAREAKGLSQEEVAALVVVASSSVVSNWELDRCEPSCDTLVKLSAILEVSLYYLLDCDEPIDVKNKEPLLNVINKLDPEYYTWALEKSNAELEKIKRIRESYNDIAPSYSIEQPLFLEKTDPNYTENKRKTKKISKLLKKQNISVLNIAEFLWWVGFSHVLPYADVASICCAEKIPNDQILTFIFAYLDGKYSICLIE